MIPVETYAVVTLIGDLGGEGKILTICVYVTKGVEDVDIVL